MSFREPRLKKQIRQGVPHTAGEGVHSVHQGRDAGTTMYYVVYLASETVPSTVQNEPLGKSNSNQEASYVRRTTVDGRRLSLR